MSQGVSASAGTWQGGDGKEVAMGREEYLQEIMEALPCHALMTGTFSLKQQGALAGIPLDLLRGFSVLRWHLWQGRQLLLACH